MTFYRPRRNRRTFAIRSLTAETSLQCSDLIYPLFISELSCTAQPISSLPGVYRHSFESLIKEVEQAHSLGIQAIILFPVISPEKKDAFGTEALNEQNILIQAIQRLKKEFPDLFVLADVALDPYTSHGHDGLLSSEGEILNDETVSVLCKMSQHLAEAGVDQVAPSDMMDGRVGAIREALDEVSASHVGIHAYCAKYASSLYAPFRDALKSSPVGDKQTYQMNPKNRREALLEASLDIEEGADALMVKPATWYLDVISAIKEKSYLPISAFHVSGEYAQLMAAHHNGWLDFDKALMESAICIKRAGADMIFTYGAARLAKLLSQNHRKSSFNDVFPSPQDQKCSDLLTSGTPHL